MPDLRWYNGSRPLRSKISVVDVEGEEETTDPRGGQWARRRVLATTRIIASRYDLGAKFECRVLWNNSADSDGEGEWPDTSLLREWLLLDIKVGPLSIRLDSPRSAIVAGETVILRCSVDGARPAANITWYNRSEAVAAHPLPSSAQLQELTGGTLLDHKASLLGPDQPPRTKISTQLMTDGTFRSSSILAFVASINDHQADFFCKGSNEVLRNRNEVPLLQGVQLQVLCKYATLPACPLLVPSISDSNSRPTCHPHTRHSRPVHLHCGPAVVTPPLPARPADLSW